MDHKGIIRGLWCVRFGVDIRGSELNFVTIHRDDKDIVFYWNERTSRRQGTCSCHRHVCHGLLESWTRGDESFQ